MDFIDPWATLPTRYWLNCSILVILGTRIIIVLSRSASKGLNLMALSLASVTASKRFLATSPRVIYNMTSAICSTALTLANTSLHLWRERESNLVGCIGLFPSSFVEIMFTGGCVRDHFGLREMLCSLEINKDPTRSYILLHSVELYMFTGNIEGANSVLLFSTLEEPFESFRYLLD